MSLQTAILSLFPIPAVPDVPAVDRVAQEERQRRVEDALNRARRALLRRQRALDLRAEVLQRKPDAAHG